MHLSDGEYKMTTGQDKDVNDAVIQSIFLKWEYLQLCVFVLSSFSFRNLSDMKPLTFVQYAPAYYFVPVFEVKGYIL